MPVTVDAHVHQVGDGLHFITDNFKVFADDSIQYGETSENCVLLSLEFVLLEYNLPTLEELWNQAYPDDPMSLEDAAYIMDTSIVYLAEFDKRSLDNLQSIVDDVRAIECHALADRVVGEFQKIGVSLR